MWGLLTDNGEGNKVCWDAPWLAHQELHKSSAPVFWHLPLFWTNYFLYLFIFFVYLEQCTCIRKYPASFITDLACHSPSQYFYTSSTELIRHVIASDLFISVLSNKQSYISWLFSICLHIIQENVAVDQQGKQKDNSTVTYPHSFKEIYAQLPGKLSKNMAKNLSVSIAFVCILHLANEKVRTTKTKTMCSNCLSAYIGIVSLVHRYWQ